MSFCQKIDMKLREFILVKGFEPRAILVDQESYYCLESELKYFLKYTSTPGNVPSTVQTFLGIQVLVSQIKGINFARETWK